MGSIIGGIGMLATGILGHNESSKDRKESSRQSDRSYALTKDELDFQKAQYNDWKSIYGPLQEDLGTYFKNLTGDNLSAQHLQAIQEESQKSQQQIDTALSQRGLTGSGLEAKAFMQNNFGTAMEKAKARASSDQLANQEKMNFLGLGLGQGAQMLGINANVANAGAGNFASMANNSLSNATMLQGKVLGMSSDFFGSVAGMGGGTASKGTSSSFGY